MGGEAAMDRRQKCERNTVKVVGWALPTLLGSTYKFWWARPTLRVLAVKWEFLVRSVKQDITYHQKERE